jgi:hypothetical protein
MSQLTGAQKASLIDALLSGYTSDEQLAELLDLHLDVKLAEIAQDGTLREQVFAVVTWFEAHGRTKDLALQAQKLRVRNQPLGAFVDALYPGERVQPPPSSRPAESRPSESGSSESGSSESGSAASLPRGIGSSDSGPRSSRSHALVYGAVAAVAVLIAIVVIALRPWRGPDDGGNTGNGGGRGEIAKDRQRLPVTMRFTDLSGIESAQKVSVDARFTPPQLAPGAALWFVVGSGQRCRERIHSAKVDNPALGYMTSIIRVERTRPTCAQLFVENANGQAIARSDPRDITFQSR